MRQFITFVALTLVGFIMTMTAYEIGRSSPCSEQESFELKPIPKGDKI